MLLLVHPARLDAEAEEKRKAEAAAKFAAQMAADLARIEEEEAMELEEQGEAVTKIARRIRARLWAKRIAREQLEAAQALADAKAWAEVDVVLGELVTQVVELVERAAAQEAADEIEAQLVLEEAAVARANQMAEAAAREKQSRGLKQSVQRRDTAVRSSKLEPSMRQQEQRCGEPETTAVNVVEQPAVEQLTSLPLHEQTEGSNGDEVPSPVFSVGDTQPANLLRSPRDEEQNIQTQFKGAVLRRTPQPPPADGATGVTDVGAQDRGGGAVHPVIRPPQPPELPAGQQESIASSDDTIIHHATAVVAGAPKARPRTLRDLHVEAEELQAILQDGELEPEEEAELEQQLAQMQHDIAARIARERVMAYERAQVSAANAAAAPNRHGQLAERPFCKTGDPALRIGAASKRDANVPVPRGGAAAVMRRHKELVTLSVMPVAERRVYDPRTQRYLARADASSPEESAAVSAVVATQRTKKQLAPRPPAEQRQRRRGQMDMEGKEAEAEEQASAAPLQDCVSLSARAAHAPGVVSEVTGIRPLSSHLRGAIWQQGLPLPGQSKKQTRHHPHLPPTEAASREQVSPRHRTGLAAALISPRVSSGVLPYSRQLALLRRSARAAVLADSSDGSTSDVSKCVALLHKPPGQEEGDWLCSPGAGGRAEALRTSWAPAAAAAALPNAPTSGRRPAGGGSGRDVGGLTVAVARDAPPMPSVEYGFGVRFPAIRGARS